MMLHKTIKCNCGEPFHAAARFMGMKLGDDTGAEKFRTNLRTNRGSGKKQVAIKGKKEGDPPRWMNAPPEPNPAAAGGHTEWPTNDEGQVNR